MEGFFQAHLEKGVWEALLRKGLVMIDERVDWRQWMECCHWEDEEVSLKDQWW